MVEWKFEVKRRSQKAREPMQDSFFTNESIEDDTHALVREAIQNSLDAKVDAESPEPVRVHFFLGKHDAGASAIDYYVPDSAWDHFTASDNGLKDPPKKDDICQYLVYEDFNTTGLIGDEQASEPERMNSFYYFMRAEGQSGKEKGDRGRHGIGKYVFPKTSGFRMFIAATVRSDDGRCLIAGQSVLKGHTVNETLYTPDGWWGQFEEDGDNDFFQLPIEGEELLSRLNQDFGLTRKITDSGLSIIMPYVSETISLETIAEHVVSEYFFPILKGQLIVELSEADDSKVIDAEVLRSDLNIILQPDKAHRLSPFINLALRSLEHGQFKLIELDLPDKAASPKWRNDYLNKDNATAINEEMEKSNGMVCVHAPLHVQMENANEPTPSHIRIYIARDPHEDLRKPFFVREGISILEDRVPLVRGYTCIVVIDKGSLATLLGDAENPAHTEWEKNASKFKGKYKWGPTTIDFVRLSVIKLLKLLSQADEEDDSNVLADIFYIDLPENDDEVPEKRKKRKKTKEAENGETGPDVEPTPVKPRYYRLTKLTGGFHLMGAEEPLMNRRKYIVKVAYDITDASKATALKKYHKNDFDFGKARGVNPIEVNNVLKLGAGGQVIQFITETNSFDLKISGFDERRDIIVDVQSQEFLNETI